MLRSLLSICLLVPIIGFAQNPKPTDLTHEIANIEMKRASRGFLKSANELSDGVDVHYVDAYWKVDPSVRFISGTVTHHFTVKTNTEQVEFDLNKNLKITGVSLNGTNTAFEHTGNLIRLTSSFLSGQNYQVSFTYSGTPPLDSSGFGSFMTATHEGTPILWTLSEPYGAPDWWPCRQNLSDKIDSIDIHVEVPNGVWQAASNGVLGPIEQLSNSKVYHWKHRYPIVTYLVAFAVTNYQDVKSSLTLSTGELPLHHMIYPELSSDQFNQLSIIRRHLFLYDSLFTPYPFMKEKYGMAQFGWGGGMEHQTMSFMHDFSYELQAHELAHQWFGDQNTCGNWEDIWLNEGFATYLTGLTYNFDSPDFYWYIWRYNQTRGVASKPGGSVYVYNTADVGRIFDSRLTYAKGAMVLHMLRWTIGDAAFFQGVRNYLNDPVHKYGFATTEQFKSIMEKAAGKQLDVFFDQWVYKEGFPTYRVSYNLMGTVVNFKLMQSTSHPSVDFFPMPVAIKFKNTDRDTTIRFQNDFSGQPYTVQLDFVPDSLIVDPDMWLVMGKPVVFKGKGDTQNHSVIVYPNPGNTTARIWFKETLNAEDKISLYDNLGRELPVILTERSANLVALDISGLAQGSYTVNITGSKVNETVRLVKTDQ